MKDLREGDKVHTTAVVELFNAFWVEPGATGTVKHLEKDSKGRGAQFVVLLDEHVDGLETWDNELVFNTDGSLTPECVGQAPKDCLEIIDLQCLHSN